VAMKRVFIRHVPETATRRLLLEKGDIDIARRLTPGDVQAIQSNADLQVQSDQRGRIYYLAGNQKNEALSKPQVREALKYLVDYDGMANSFLKGQMVVHQALLPAGFLGAIDDKPFKLDVAKAKDLLKQAGYPDGFSVKLAVRNDPIRVDMAQAIQNTFAQAGIKLDINATTGAEELNAYRARQHELILESWGPDYPDPQTNASTFADNPDNSDTAKNAGYLAWRNAYDAKETKDMVNAAVVEQNTDKRKAMYEDMQRLAQKVSPFVWLFQETEQIGERKSVKGFSTGGAVSSAFYWTVTK
jgi:peptide/nickel transport system substrate-binding protein